MTNEIAHLESGFITVKRVLIISYHFPPSAASGTFRMLGFVRHLPKFGWRSIVVAPPRLPWEPIDEALLDRVPKETQICHVPYPEGWMSKPWRRVAPFGVWLPKAFVACREAIRVNRPDAILTSGPPHIVHLLGRHIHHKFDLPWISDFRDPWVTGDRSTMKQDAKRWEKLAETLVMRDSDRIIANTPKARDRLVEAQPRYASKIIAITNGYDPENFQKSSKSALSGQTARIAHLGEIYANRNPGPFLEAIRDLRVGNSSPALGYQIRFYGSVGESAAQLINKIEALGLQNVVTICGQVPYQTSLVAMSDADMLLLIDTPGRRCGVPAKLYEYIGSGRPILALAEPDSDVAWVLRESGRLCRIVSPTDPVAIREGLQQILGELAKDREYQSENNGATRFERQFLASELAMHLESCCHE